MMKSLDDHFDDSPYSMDDFYTANIVVAITANGKFTVKDRWAAPEKHMSFKCEGPVAFKLYTDKDRKLQISAR